jgi:predicted enzyme related to lactoylglutathione lyase
VRLRSVVIDCPEPAVLASFYADLLEGHADTGDPDWCEVRFDNSSFKLALQRAESYVRPVWPDGAAQQMHLDLTVSDLQADCRRAESLGATVLSDPVEESDCVYVVHADPAGHPFCLCEER